MMRFTLVYIFDSDKKRNEFMKESEYLLDNKTYELKLNGIKELDVYKLLDILTHYPNEPISNKIPIALSFNFSLLTDKSIILFP